jgi:hypothetical protein
MCFSSPAVQYLKNFIIYWLKHFSLQPNSLKLNKAVHLSNCQVWESHWRCSYVLFLSLWLLVGVSDANVIVFVLIVIVSFVIALLARDYLASLGLASFQVFVVNRWTLVL